MIYERICKQCGAPFTTHIKRKIYHHEDCYIAAKRQAQKENKSSYERQKLRQRLQYERKRRAVSKSVPLSEINAAARAEHLSYGQYQALQYMSR